MPLQVTEDEHNIVPYSTEESGGRSPGGGRREEENENRASIDLDAARSTSGNRFPTSDTNLSQNSTVNHSRTQSVDRKIRQDIINGVNYLEKRNDELVDINKHLRVDIESVSLTNERLRDEIFESERRYQKLEIENDEWKIQQDGAEKEKARLKEQIVQEWTGRVKAEELLMEAKRDGEAEIRTLRDQLATLSSTSATDIDFKAQALEHKVARLGEKIERMKAEKDRDSETAARMESQLVDWKVRFDDKCVELDAHVQRFVSLKKSFNGLLAENERLQAKIVSSGQSGGGGNYKGPNSTWPTNNNNNVSSLFLSPRTSIGESRGGVETVSIVDLNEQYNSSYRAQGPTFTGGARVKTVRGVESFPATVPRVLRRKQSCDMSAFEGLPPVLTATKIRK